MRNHPDTRCGALPPNAAPPRDVFAFFIASTFALALLLAGCGRRDAEPLSPAAAASAAAHKTLVVGTDAAYAPFESQNEKAEIVGFDIDIVKAVAAEAGLSVTFVNTPWEGIFNALAQGDRDLLVSAITITDERRQTVDFTAPYFDARQLIAVRPGARVARFDDLKTLTVGVQTGTTGDDVVSRLLGKTSDRIRRFDSTPIALKELEAGGVDAVVADNGVVAHHVANNPSAGFRTVVDASFEPEHYGIAVRKGNADLVAKLDRGIAAIRADGSYERIHSAWFGGGAASASMPLASNAGPASAAAPMAAASVAR